MVSAADGLGARLELLKLVGPRRGGTLTRPLKALQSPVGRLSRACLRALCASELIVNKRKIFSTFSAWDS